MLKYNNKTSNPFHNIIIVLIDGLLIMYIYLWWLIITMGITIEKLIQISKPDDVVLQKVIHNAIV